MKFLKAIRLDASDASLYKREGAAEEDEWLVCGGYAVCDIASGEHFFAQCRCDSSFVALAGGRRCTIAEVAEIDEAILKDHIETLSGYFIAKLNAPSREAALRVAEEEVRYTAELCETFTTGVWITVARTLNDAGDAVREHYRAYDRLLIGTHKL
ncbi:MAG: hypothetical protein H0U63_05945 [Burkholderiales bacterium]|nr:hypothetical protein [Burkholderiales bacterium]